MEIMFHVIHHTFICFYQSFYKSIFTKIQEKYSKISNAADPKTIC